MPTYIKKSKLVRKNIKPTIDREAQLRKFIECHKHSNNCKCFANVPGARSCGLDGCSLPKKPKYSKKYFAGGVIGQNQCAPGDSCAAENGRNGLGICQNCPP